MSPTANPSTLLQRSDSIVDPSSLPTPQELSDKPSIIPHEESSTIVGASETAKPAAAPTTTGSRILLAYVDTDEAQVAWDWALKHVKADDRVFVLSVLPVNSIDPVVLYGVTDIASTFAVQQNLEMLRTLRKKTIADLTYKAKEFEGKVAGIQIHVVHGEARQAVPRCADYHNCDTIVLGRRDLHGWKRLTSSGSVSSHVIAHSKQTVVVAKA